jgi:hypothetical protein
MISSLRPYLPVVCLVFTGCGGTSDVREYEVKQEFEKILTSDLLRDQFESIPFRWKVPADWKVAENDQFSAFAWSVGTGESAARITVSDLPASAGLEPQFLRWRGQLNLPEVDPAEGLKNVETISLKSLSGKYIEIKGDSESIFGMIVPYKDKLWVFKYRSENSTAERQRKPFRDFCESLTVE